MSPASPRGQQMLGELLMERRRWPVASWTRQCGCTERMSSGACSRRGSSRSGSALGWLSRTGSAQVS